MTDGGFASGLWPGDPSEAVVLGIIIACLVGLVALVIYSRHVGPRRKSEPNPPEPAGAEQRGEARDDAPSRRASE